MNLTEVSKLTETEARETLERIRWPTGPICSHCGCYEGHTKFKGKAHRVGVYKCNKGCGKQFSVTTNSIMEASHLPIRTWLMAFAMICSSKKGVSALQLQRQLGLGSYRTAWHMAHRIRHAMMQEPLKGLLDGVVMADETYVGGKPRKYARYAQRPYPPKSGHFGRGTKKTPVFALVERDGRARSFPVTDVTAKTLHRLLKDNVSKNAKIMTDEFPAYNGLAGHFIGGHETINHGSGEYVRGDVSTNEVEAYFALLKRGITGSFHSVSKKHLHRYCNEFSYRWNHRKETDAVRTVTAIEAAGGKRLMYQDPIKKPVRVGEQLEPFKQ